MKRLISQPVLSFTKTFSGCAIILLLCIGCATQSRISLTESVKPEIASIAVAPLNDQVLSATSRVYAERIESDLSGRFGSMRDVRVCGKDEIGRVRSADNREGWIGSLSNVKYIVTGRITAKDAGFDVEVSLYKVSGRELLRTERFALPVDGSGTIPECSTRELAYQIGARENYLWYGIWWDQPSQNSAANDYYFRALDMTRFDWSETGENSKELFELSRALIDSAVNADTSFTMAKILQHLIVSHTNALRFYYDDSTRAAAVAEAERLATALHEGNSVLPEIAMTYFSQPLSGADSAKCELPWLKALEIRPDFAGVKSRLAELRAQQGRSAEAVQYWREALADYTKFGDWRNQAEVHFALALHYRDVKEFELGCEAGETAIAILGDRPLSSFTSVADLALKTEITGVIYSEKRDYTKAAELLKRAAELMGKALADKPPPQTRSGDYWTAYLMNSFYHSLWGRYERYSGDFSTALTASQRSSDLAISFNEPELVRSWRNDMIGIYRCLGDYQKALETARFDSMGLKRENWLRDVAAIHRSMGDMDSSERYLMMAWEIVSEDTSNPPSEYLLNNRRETQLQLAINAFCRRDYRESLAIINSIQVDSTVNRDWKQLFDFYRGAGLSQTGRVEEGLALMNSAYREIVIYEHLVTCLRSQGETLDVLGKSEEARICWLKGRTLAEKAGMRGEVAAFEVLLKRR